MNTPDTAYIFDFDGTLVAAETFEIMAHLALVSDPHRDAKVRQIQAITEQGMNGVVSFDESLRRRFALLTLTKDIIEKTTHAVEETITLSLMREREFFTSRAQSIYIVSGGFYEIILPVAIRLGIAADHIFANTFIYTRNACTGYDMQNPLAHEQGKCVVVKSLPYKHKIMIGDGFTDLEVRLNGYANTFVAFTEHAYRADIAKRADIVLRSGSGLDQLI